MQKASEIEVRAVATEDYECWLGLWTAYQAFYKTEIPIETSLKTWARFNDPHEPVWAALAWRESEPVGLVHWIFHRSTWTVGDYCYLQDLLVDPRRRGQGVGRLLIDHVYARAAEAGCSRVYWLTHESNETAMKLYDQVAEKSGFLQYRKQL